MVASELMLCLNCTAGERNGKFRGLGVSDLGRTREESEQGARGPVNTLGRLQNEMMANEVYPSW